MNLVEKYLCEGFKLEVAGGSVPVGRFSFEYIMQNGKSPKYVINSAEARKKGKGWNYKIVKQTKNSVVIHADAKMHDSLWQSFGSMNEPITVKDYH
jgi:hypothetical protein